jgi:hypothetical protein
MKTLDETDTQRAAVAHQRLVRRLHPRARWVNLDGPPGHGKSPVWEHPNGARLHVGGLLRLPDGASTTIDWWDRRYQREMRLATIMQPVRRVRALMVWAELIMFPTNV